MINVIIRMLIKAFRVTIKKIHGTFLKLLEYAKAFYDFETQKDEQMKIFFGHVFQKKKQNSFTYSENSNIQHSLLYVETRNLRFSLKG